jgi:hypothetical protein
MAKSSKVAFAALLVALVITSIGWARASTDPSWERLGTCIAADGRLNVTFTYGANERTALVLDTRDDGGVISVEQVHGTGDTPDIGLGGQASLLYQGDLKDLRYPDGDRVKCKES